MNNLQTGGTTRQMLVAPIGAVYVWCSSQLAYPRELAKKIGRTDLEIVSLGWITTQKWAGRELKGFVIDHYVVLPEAELMMLPYIKSRIR
jgi:hypothetical protein